MRTAWDLGLLQACVGCTRETRRSLTHHIISEGTSVKTHISLQTRDLDASIAFYRTLLQREPDKHFSDYAFFSIDDPALELAINPTLEPIPLDRTHYGVAVNDANSVDEAIERLRAAAYDIDIEREETCCYAKQTKVWTSDPDGRRWEVYAVLDETEQREDSRGMCCSGADQ